MRSPRRLTGNVFLIARIRKSIYIKIFTQVRKFFCPASDIKLDFYYFAVPRNAPRATKVIRSLKRPSENFTAAARGLYSLDLSRVKRALDKGRERQPFSVSMSRRNTDFQSAVLPT
jgi:hypothetical protein